MSTNCQTGTIFCQSVRTLNQRGGTIVSLITVLFTLSMLFNSCGTEEKGIDLQPYFFPMNSLEDGMVYRYESSDTLVPKYIYYRAISDDTLLIKRYNQDKKPDQISRWVTVSNGVQIDSLILFHRDSTGSVRETAQIEYEDVYPFRVRDSLDLVLFKVHWNDPLEAGRSYTVVKNRRFEDTTEFLYNGTAYPAVRLNVQEAIDDHQQGTLEIELSGWEIYAKGLGLVAWQKSYKDRVIQSYRLTDRMSPEEIELQ